MHTLLTDLPKLVNGQTRYIGNLAGSGRSLLIAEQASNHQGLTLVVARNSESAAQLHTEISFYGGDLQILSFPDWETLPYDSFSPHQDIISQRLYCLYQLQQLEQAILIVPASTLMQRLPPKSYLTGNSLVLKTGQQLNTEQMRQQLAEAGYHSVDTVYEHGEFAARGSILDIYPMGSQLPYRIDLFDDEIDTLRTFDPESQRSIDQVDSIRLLPAKEFPLNKTAIANFRQQWRERFDVDPRNCPVYQDVSNGLAPAGIEYYLPLFFQETCSLQDYLPEQTQLFTDKGTEDACQEFWLEISSRYESRAYDIERPILPPHQAFHEVNSVFAQLKQTPRTELNQVRDQNTRHSVPLQNPPELPVNAKAANPLQAVQELIENHQGRLLFCAESAGRREALLELLERIDVQPVSVPDWQQFCETNHSVCITVSPIEEGLSAPQQNFELITESQLFGQRVLQQRRRQSSEQDNSDLIFRNLTELQQGAPVVHEQHGVGRYTGLQSLELDGQSNEFLVLEYADEAKLYVPVSGLHLISRYSGASDSLAPLHKLGSEQWGKAKRKAMEKIRDTAAELLDIYARRGARKGRAFASPDEQYEAFAANFPFEETPDQQQAIHAVVKDLTATKPMDRLVCGDVGFGKTEVALRAAFVAVQSGHQVAILAPTTLLAQQHFQTFQ
ncbi:MAG: DEAD/DEAH box helicase, partial [Motiliproteus sp.]|nr:DEAD/DEAH box helicase [Motiliproteus sp.]